MDIINLGLSLGDVGVAIAQIITALNPASWWASGILGLIRTGLEALMGLIAG